MKVGGFQKLDMVDYPGHVASIVFTSGCNFHCPYCHNPTLVTGGGENIDESEVLSYLASRKRMLDGLVISGGEPCLHPLGPFIKKVREIGLLVKLDTNGSRPLVLQSLLEEKLLDYVAIDVKTGRKRYREVTGGDWEPTDRSIAMLRASGIDYEFRTTCVPTLVTDDDIADIAEWIKGSKRWILQKFNPRVTLEAECGAIEAYGDAWYEAMIERHGDSVGSMTVR